MTPEARPSDRESQGCRAHHGQRNCSDYRRRRVVTAHVVVAVTTPREIGAVVPAEDSRHEPCRTQEREAREHRPRGYHEETCAALRALHSERVREVAWANVQE